MEPFASGGDVKIITVVLTVAHLDHGVTDYRLKAMCQYCHLNYDANEKYRRAVAKSDQKCMVI